MIAFWLYYYENINSKPDLLLLDEPDAFLHPSLTRDFIYIVKNIIAGKYGIRTILTTHSPITVNLLDENDLFIVNNNAKDGQVIKSISKQAAVNTLTEGLLLVTDNTHPVFLEGKKDSPYYRTVFEVLVHSNVLKKFPNFVFISYNGKESLHNFSEQFSLGDLRFLAIEDKDKDTTVFKKGIFRLKRYAVENYVYDPLLLLGCIINNGAFKNLIDINNYQILSLYDFLDIIKNDQIKIQAAVDKICEKIAEEFFINNHEKIDIVYVIFLLNSTLEITFKIPHWFVNNNIKIDIQKILKVMRDLGATDFSGSVSTINIIRSYKILPKDMIDMLKQLQENAASI